MEEMRRENEEMEIDLLELPIFYGERPGQSFCALS